MTVELRTLLEAEPLSTVHFIPDTFQLMAGDRKVHTLRELRGYNGILVGYEGRFHLDVDLDLYADGKSLNRKWLRGTSPLIVTTDLNGRIDGLTVDTADRNEASRVEITFLEPLLAGLSLRLWFPQYNFLRNVYIFGWELEPAVVPKSSLRSEEGYFYCN